MNLFKFKCGVLFSLFLCASQGFAKLESIKQVSKPEDKSFVSHLSFDYTYSNTNINHSETSSTTGFTSLNEDINLMIHFFGIGYEFEMFAHSRISLTTHLSGGFQSGEDVHENEGSSGQVNFFEKASGYYGAAGISLNWNSRHSYKKTQYFIGARTLKTKTKFFLRAIDDATTERSNEIQYDLEQTVMESSLGVRFLTFGSTNMYSTISLNSVTNTTDKIEAKASRGDTEFDLIDLADFKSQDMTLRLGFGFLY